MLFLNKLAPEYRRRYYTNLAIILALVLFVCNVGRLGRKNSVTAVLVLMCLGIAYIAVWPLVQVVRARPRPAPALALAATNLAAFTYVLASGFFKTPGLLLALLFGVVCLWTLMIAYRGIMLPSLFARNGAPSERWRVIREAQRASRDERKSLYPPQ